MDLLRDSPGDAVFAGQVGQYPQGRLELGAMFQHVDPAVDQRQARVVGSFYQALLTGVLAQWLIDPEHALSGEDLTDALRAIVARIGPADEPATRSRN